MKRPTKEQLAADIQTDMTWKEIADKYGYTDARFIRKLRVRYGLPARRIYLKPTKEELHQMIEVERLSPYEVADKLGYSEGGWSNIYKYCREYGIPVDFKPHYEERHTPMTDYQKSVVLGTLLGDGSIVNGALKLTHGFKQLEYLKWKKDLLTPYMIDKLYERNNKQNENSPYSKYAGYSYTSIALDYFKELRDKCYPNGIKRVNREWLDQLNDIGLTVWYLDDGSLNKRYGTIAFCTMCFTLEEHYIMQEWFEDRWDIETKIEPRKRRGKTTYALRINASQRRKFFDIVSPHVPDCMKYKITFG